MKAEEKEAIEKAQAHAAWLLDQLIILCGSENILLSDMAIDMTVQLRPIKTRLQRIALFAEGEGE